jgi:hypothetical protein
MALSDRAAAAGPYAQQLLDDRDVQDALRRAFGATRRVYARGRGRSAGQAVRDKKFRGQLQQAVAAVAQALSVLSKPTPRRKSRFRGKLVAAAVVSAGGFFLLNADARERVSDLLGKHDAKPADVPQ